MTPITDARFSRRRSGAVLVTALLLGACAQMAPLQGNKNAFLEGPVCDYGAVRFDGDFEAGRLSACRQTGRDAYILYIRPEDTPINPSPWYAFDVEAKRRGELELTLSYVHGRHRYIPKTRRGDGPWQAVDDVVESEDRTTASFRLMTDGPVRVAAQPLLTAVDDEALLALIEERTGAETEIIGQSEQGRDLRGIRFGAEDAPLLLLLGRAHPPETQGAVGMAAFIERLTEDDALATRFRQAFGVAALPTLNPDGVARGHWRHNTGGVDLNRDWGPFLQAETRAARDWVRTLPPPVVVLDFHATRRDVLYTQADDAEGERTWFARELHDGLIEAFGEDAPDRDSSHNPDLPTAKTWFHATFGIPALTYEVGDNTPIEQAQAKARIAAELTMTLMLDGPIDETRP
jgi:hypothetical protein